MASFNVNSYSSQEDKGIALLIRQEAEYQDLIKSYNKSLNPSILKEIHRKYFILCKAWDTVRLNNS